ncbi:MAG: cellulose biosynthesis cyclic di-GMP-binding regulatory protein BcsB [Burkholderiales bacterium]
MSRILKIFALLAPLLLQQTAGAEIIKLPLQKFTAMSSMDIRCINGSREISIPIPERWKLHKLTLDLRYTVSNTMLSDISQMVVKVNGNLVTQLKLDHQGPEVGSLIEIPVKFLKTGYNTLSFQVAQHYLKDGCEQVCAPDLWTDVSLTNSTLQMDYELKPIPLKLGQAAGLIFDPTQFPSASVHLVTDTSTPEGVTIAGIAASGIARRFDYRKVNFSHSPDIKPGVDNILIGKASFVGDVLLKYGILLDAPKGGLIRIYYLPKSDGGNDGLHALIVITGDQPAAVKIASETFANMSMPYPGTDQMHAYAFSMPDISMGSGRDELVPDKIYKFKTLGMNTVTFQGLSANVVTEGASQLSFRLPSDFLIKQNQSAKLVLNFSYAAGLLKDSSLSVLVNGRRVHDIHLNNTDGGFIDAYKLDIPTYLFKPGSNVISFEPYLNIEHKLCELYNANAPFVSIFGNSTMYFPPMPHFVEMPELELFTLNGFPFSRWPDGYQTLIYLPKPDGASIDTALNLIGMITQKNGFPLFGTRVVFSDPGKYDGEMLVVGEAAALPKSILAHAPLQPSGIANVRYPITRGWDSETAIALSKQQAGLGADNGLLMEFESPSVKGRSIIVATAQTEDDLRKLGDALLEPNVQSSIFGDVTLVRLDAQKYGANSPAEDAASNPLEAPKYEATSMKVGKTYSTGNKGDISYLDAFLYSNKYVFYVLVALAILLLGLIGYWLLKRYRKKRIKVAEGAKRE